MDRGMSKIKLIDVNGKSHILDAVEGWRVMEIIREHGFDVGGLCGGACACATCHVYVEPEWQDKDPQIPKSRWWLSDAPFAGFRIVCEP